MLGRGKASDIGAAVALELEDGTYIPIHDHRGNIVTLLDSYGHAAESMRYTAFGEESASKPISPWRFASKRYDPETGFVYFGQRYYSPSTGRWITPDPSGFADGPNLYAYVLNNPMTLFDPYGLSWWDDARDWISHAADSFVQAARVHEENHSELLDNCTREEDHAAMDAVCRSNLGKATAVGCTVVAVVAIATVAIEWSVPAGVVAFVRGASSPAVSSVPQCLPGGGIGSTAVGSTFLSKVAAKFLKSGSKTQKTKGIKNKASGKPSHVQKSTGGTDRNYSPAGSKHSPMDNTTFQSTRNDPTVINNQSYSGHAIDQMQNRGLMPSSIENTIKTGNPLPGKYPGTTMYHDTAQGIKVVVNNEGKVITAYYNGGN